MLLDEFRRHRSRHGDYQRVRLEIAANLVEHIGHRRRLHRQQHDVGAAHGRAIVGRHRDAQFFGQRIGALLVTHRGRDVRRRDQLLIEKGAQQRAAHLPCPQHRQPFVRKRIAHRANILGHFATPVNQTSDSPETGEAARGFTGGKSAPPVNFSHPTPARPVARRVCPLYLLKRIICKGLKDPI